MDDRRHTTIDSPIGPLTLVASGRFLSGLYMDAQHHRPASGRFGVRDGRPFGAVREQLTAYFDGHLTEFELPLAIEGTPFQRAVWQRLQAIPYGEVRTYGQLAVELGRPGACRAVGAANGRNPVAVVVPCHRVIASGGRLGGYGGGLERKRRLLDHERRLLDQEGRPLDQERRQLDQEGRHTGELSLTAG